MEKDIQLSYELAFITNFEKELVKMVNENQKKIDKLYTKYNEGRKSIDDLNQARTKYIVSIKKLEAKAKKKGFPITYNHLELLNKVYNDFDDNNKKYINGLANELKELGEPFQDQTKIYQNLERIAYTKDRKIVELKSDKKIVNQKQDDIALEVKETSMLEKLGEITPRKLNNLSDRDFEKLIDEYGEVYIHAASSMFKEISNVYSGSINLNELNVQQQNLNKITFKALDDFNIYYNKINMSSIYSKLDSHKQEIYKHQAIRIMSKLGIKDETTFKSLDDLKLYINTKAVQKLVKTDQIYHMYNNLTDDDLCRKSIMYFTKFMTLDEIKDNYKIIGDKINDYYVNDVHVYNIDNKSNEDMQKEQIDLENKHYKGKANFQRTIISKIINLNNMEFTNESVKWIANNILNEKLLEENENYLLGNNKELVNENINSKGKVK